MYYELMYIIYILSRYFSNKFLISEMPIESNILGITLADSSICRQMKNMLSGRYRK